MDAPKSPPVYKDRRTGLLIFGVIEILLGCLCLLLVPLILFGHVMGAKATGKPPDYKVIMPSVIMYPFLAVAFVWLGIGSIKKRRWARAVSLIIGWAWLLAGVAGIVGFVTMGPAIFSGAAGGQPLPPGARIVMLVTAALMLGVFFVAAPATLILFYRSPHVRATCEAADPHPAWTDACPLPVLAVSLWLLVAALWMPLMPLFYNSVMPFFGILLQGIAGTLVFLVLAVLWLYAAWSLYRLKPIGWWITAITMGLLVISSAITFSSIDIMEMYRAMGYSEELLQQMQQMKFSGRQFTIWGVIGGALMLGYLIFIYRYFRRPGLA
ncbi:MAG: hypothetical protein L0Y58_00070 [Verrucomicrobia subdivision 3 bacterium]|nr:hypothetical protein [Limisphaerales bacterium]